MSRPNLEDVGKVSEIEDVVELDGCWEESGGHLLMEVERRGDNLIHTFLYLGHKPSLVHVL